MRFATLAVAVCIALPATTLTGCKGSGGLSGLLGSSDAMSLLSPLVKDAANSYVANLTSIAEMLQGVNGLQDAIRVAEKIQPAVKDVSNAYSTLASTSGADRSNLIKAFGPKFDTANASFLGQSGRIKGDSLAGKAMGSVLDQVKLFK